MKAHENPFRSERIEGLGFRFVGETLDGLIAKLKAMDYRAAIVGPKGSGKTTLLETLESALVNDGLAVHRIFVNDTIPFTLDCQSRLADVPDRRMVVFLDGADRLSRQAWKRLDALVGRNAKGLLITSHTRGRLPVLLECETTPELFALLAQELAGSESPISRELLDRLFARYRGNLRDCFRSLYDLYAAM